MCSVIFGLTEEGSDSSSHDVYAVKLTSGYVLCCSQRKPVRRVGYQQQCVVSLKYIFILFS